MADPHHPRQRVEAGRVQKNPVFLWAHRSGEPPIGKTVDIRTESNPPALVQTVEFASKDVYPFADTIFNLYGGGYLKAVSVGFMPLEMPKRIKDAEDNTIGYEFVNQELLELSAVPIPANAEALARAISKGVISSSERALLSVRQDEPAEPPEDEPAGSPADTAEELGEALAEIATAVADAQKLCAVLVSQLEPGEPAGTEDAAPAGKRNLEDSSTFSVRRRMTPRAADRELVAVYEKLSGVAVSLAKAAMKQTREAVKGARSESELVSIEDLVTVVEEAGAKIQAAAANLETSGAGKIDSMESFGRALGLGNE